MIRKFMEWVAVVALTFVLVAGIVHRVRAILPSVL
jgi:hypothetical protein